MIGELNKIKKFKKIKIKDNIKARQSFENFFKKINKKKSKFKMLLNFLKI